MPKLTGSGLFYVEFTLLILCLCAGDLVCTEMSINANLPVVNSDHAGTMFSGILNQVYTVKVFFMGS